MTKHAEISMRDYQANYDICRRDYLFNDVDNYVHENSVVGCMCCDICFQACECGTCHKTIKFYFYLTFIRNFFFFAEKLMYYNSFLI